MGYFDQICTLADQGTKLMDNNKPLQTIANDLLAHGLPVSCVDDDPKNQQIYLSVCANRDQTTGLPTSGVLHWKYVAQVRESALALFCGLLGAHFGDFDLIFRLTFGRFCLWLLVSDGPCF